MKRLVALGLLSILAAGCSSDDGPTDPGGSSSGGAMSARIDGANWTAQSVTASYLGGVLSVSGTDGTSTINLSAAVQATGPQDLAAGSANGNVVIGSSTWYAVGQGGSGTMTVTSLSASGAAGTFAFTGGPLPGGATGTRTITEGTFSVQY